MPDSIRFTVVGIIMLCLGALLVSPVLANDGMIVRRAAFEIGAAAIKCTVADVDIESGDIVNVVETYTRKMDFAEDLALSYDENLSREIMDNGIEVLRQLKIDALQLRATQFAAVGGIVFRQARNGRAYFVEIREKIGIATRVVSKQQAAMLSFYSVQQSKNVPRRDLLVWDIGGASQEMCVRVESGALAFNVDALASIPFKHVVISKILGMDPNVTSSPNPLDAEQVRRAVEYVEDYAVMNTNPKIIRRIKDGLVNVYGVGGVLYYAVPELIGDRAPSFSREEVEAAVEKWTGKPDEAFGSEYAPSRLTNLILVCGYMNALGIEKVSPLKVNQTHGLLVSPEFWR